MSIVSFADTRGDAFSFRQWGVVLAVWSAVAAFSVGQIYVARTALGHPPPLAPLLVLELPVWAFWALVTVPIVMLARRFPLDRTRVLRSVLLHALTAVLVAVSAVAFQMLWYQAFNPYPMGGSSPVTWFWEYFRRYFVVGFMIYWAAVGVYHAFANYFRYREREVAASRATAQLTEARLRALRMQLHPHFLFNTLNSVSALIDDQPGDARRVLAQLADLLRAALRTDTRHIITLEDELDFLQRYLDIERIRFGERLDVTLGIDPATRRAGVPSFLLQPLVENAIRHGVARRETPGRIWLSSERANGSLVLNVMDDGPGLPPLPVPEGIGLSNTRRRLAELYGADHQLSLRPRPGGGLHVRVDIPYRVLGANG